jgi:hypothetical protein
MHIEMRTERWIIETSVCESQAISNIPVEVGVDSADRTRFGEIG